MQNKFELYTQVQLTKPLPEFHFEKGDVATLVDIVNGTDGNQGYVLEFFDNSGCTLQVVVVTEDFITHPPLHAVVNYRPYMAA